MDPGGVHPARDPPKIGKNMIFWHKIVIFHTKYPNNFSRLPPLGAIFLSAPALTWNPGAAPALQSFFVQYEIQDGGYGMTWFDIRPYGENVLKGIWDNWNLTLKPN